MGIAFSIEKILALYAENPDAEIIAHPESQAHLLKVAKYVGSTSGLLNYVQTSDAKKFIIATEVGILHKMRQLAPDKILIPAPVDDDNCNCSECFYMKMNTMRKLYLCLKHELPHVEVEAELSKKALVSIERMLELS